MPTGLTLCTSRYGLGDRRVKFEFDDGHTDFAEAGDKATARVVLPFSYVKLCC